MNRTILLLAVSATLIGASCAGIPRATFYRAPNFDSNASFKVITLNTSDVLSGRIEHFLLINNFKVISDNSFRMPAPLGFPNPTFPADTTIYSPGQTVINIPYMQEKPSDYIVRYQFDNAESSQTRSSLNMAVVNTQTGQVEVSYLTEQTGRMELPAIDRSIRNVIGRMRQSQ
ncbi:MAG: hypothetical protein KF852_16805 [Saprospiraceae bacterium]|nr:hypothetical protein [Saprospiraceae bacterium]